MSEKWLKQDEYILLEGKIWTWVRVIVGPSLTKAKVFLTNQRLYGIDAMLKMKLFDFPFDSIKKIEKTKNNLIIEAEIKGKKQRIDLKLKNMDESWEWMIRERVKVSKR
jgi:hypothetical protein